MRYALAAFALIHGVCHLAGFAVVDRPSIGYGLVWLALAAGFGVLAAGVWMRSSWWLRLMVLLVVCSTICCLFALPEARLGLLANAIVLALACAAVRFPGPLPACRHPGLEQLWSAATAPSVRIRMHGEIRIGKWHPFIAEQVIDPKRGMIWAGTASMFGLPVRGADQVLDGKGIMDWRLFDLIRVAFADGPDTARSGAGRLLGEMAIFLPTVLRGEWFGEKTDVTIACDDGGRIRSVAFPRWGNPDGAGHRYIDFGVVVEQERSFGGNTLPSRIRAGWFFGTERFATEGEFFHATIDGIDFK